MVEDDLLDLRIGRDRLELAEPTRMPGVDDDEPADRVELEPRGLDRAQLVRMEARELPNVAVQRAGEADDGLRVQPPCSEHGRKSVEIRVPVCGDDLFGTH